MTIRPISSVNFANGYNNVNFGERRKKSENTHTVPHRLAVPLAAAITLVPLNIIDAKSSNNDLDINNKIEYVDGINSVKQDTKEKGVVIESKDFNSKIYGNYKINLVSTDGNAKNFEKVVMLKYNDIIGKTLSNDVKNLSVYNYQVISDDGSKGTSFELKDVLVDSGMDSTPYTYNQADLLNYVEGLIDDPRNNKAINKVTNNRKIKPDQDGYFQNVPKGDVLKNAVPCKINAKLVGAEDVLMEGQKIGVLRYYSVNGSDEKIDQITYQKNGYPELRISQLFANKHIFEPYSEAPSYFNTGIINLVDGNNKSYYIEEPGLVYGLAGMKAKEPEKFKYSIIGSSVDVNYLITPNIGAIMPVVPEEDY